MYRQFKQICNVHCKSGYTIFFNQPSLQPPVYTNLTWEVLMYNNNFLIKMAGKKISQFDT